MEISSISAKFRNDVPFGETIVEYRNGTRMSFTLNNKGHFCGIQKIENKSSKSVTIQHVLLNRSLTWVKSLKYAEYYIFTNSTNNYLSKDLNTVVSCEHVGDIYGIKCQDGWLKFEDNFPIIDKELFNKNVTYDLHFPSGEKRNHSDDKIRSLSEECKSSQFISSWISYIEKDPWISLEYRQIAKNIGLEGNLIYVDLHEARVPKVFQPNFVEIKHNGQNIHNGKIDFEAVTGLTKLDLKPSKLMLDKIFSSFARFVPFEFKFTQKSKGRYVNTLS